MPNFKSELTFSDSNLYKHSNRLSFEYSQKVEYVTNIRVGSSSNIGSRFPKETTSFGPQTFIVKLLIIGNTESHHIYIRTERRGKGLTARETERERVCVRDREWLKMGLVLVVKMAVGETDHFGII